MLRLFYFVPIVATKEHTPKRAQCNTVPSGINRINAHNRSIKYVMFYERDHANVAVAIILICSHYLCEGQSSIAFWLELKGIDFSIKCLSLKK